MGQALQVLMSSYLFTAVLRVPGHIIYPRATCTGTYGNFHDKQQAEQAWKTRGLVLYVISVWNAETQFSRNLVRSHPYQLSNRVQNVHTLQWRHNGRNGVSNHQPHDCLLKRLFKRRSKEISKLRVTGLCAGNSPVTAENVSIRWRHHGARHWYCNALCKISKQFDHWAIGDWQTRFREIWM